MAHCSKHNSSSTDSSEDEEEARKIREALCDESIYKVHKTDQNSQKASFELKNKTLHFGHTQVEVRQKPIMKSNRTEGKNDNEDDNILKTTPEFRNYVSKQLFNMLDSALIDIIKDGVWHVPQPVNIKQATGIRLYSDSKTFCRVGDEQEKTEKHCIEPNKATSSKYKHKKHKLSSSSESSDDEQISACVFSVADIQKENECLAKLEKQTRTGENDECMTKPSPKSTLNQISDNSTVESDKSVSKKENKQRKSKHSTKTNGIV